MGARSQKGRCAELNRPFCTVTHTRLLAAGPAIHCIGGLPPAKPLSILCEIRTVIPPAISACARPTETAAL
jgi:hypothetical protein